MLESEEQLKIVKYKVVNDVLEAARGVGAHLFQNDVVNVKVGKKKCRTDISTDQHLIGYAHVILRQRRDHLQSPTVTHVVRNGCCRWT